MPLPTGPVPALAATASRPAAAQLGARPSFYERAKRGEYPLWLLLLAGVIFGGLIILLVWSFLSSFGVTPPPLKLVTD